MEKPPLAAAIATAVISTLAIAEVQAEVNPFATNAMPSGYMQLAADHDAAFAQYTRREDYKNQLARTAAGEERQRKAALLKERNQWMAEQDIDPNDRSAVIQTMGRSPYVGHQNAYANIQGKFDHINANARNLGIGLARMRMNDKSAGMEPLSDKEDEQLQAIISALMGAGSSKESTLEGIEKTLRLMDEIRQYIDYLRSLGERRKYDPSKPKRTFKFQHRFNSKQDPEQAPAEGRKIIRDENGKPTHILFPNGRREELSQELRNIQ